LKKLRIEVVCIGSELLSSKTSTHTVTIGQQLSRIGLDITREQTVGDDKKYMEEVFRQAFMKGDVIFSSGGLGPTFDDVTREVWSKVTRRSLRIYQWIVDEIRQKFRTRGVKMPPENRRQGFLLKGAEIIPNQNGTAPGQYIEIGKKILILLPGPKRELYPMVETFVIPKLHERFPGRYAYKKEFHMVGVPESVIDNLVRPLVKKYRRINGCDVVHGILADQSVITVKFNVGGKIAEKVDEAGNILDLEFRRKLSPYIFGEDNDRLEKVIGDLLRRKGKTLAVAESCTGGLISKMLTDIPGSSLFLNEGVTTYSNESKVYRLGVKPSTLKRFGGVSSQVAEEMALGLKKRTSVDFTISVTGIAGPEGGLPEKPVGLVYIACSGPEGTKVKEFRFNGDRDWIRHRSALMALEMLRKEVIR